MISDNPSLQSVQTVWNSVRVYEDALDQQFNAPSLSSVSPLPERDDVCYSLLVLFAFAALEDALKLLRAEKAFLSELDRLIYMMDNSRTQLPWVDFQAILAYRNQRNKIRYDQKMVSRTEAKKILHGIERELTAWNLLPSNGEMPGQQGHWG